MGRGIVLVQQKAQSVAGWCGLDLMFQDLKKDLVGVVLVNTRLLGHHIHAHWFLRPEDGKEALSVAKPFRI